MNQCNVRLCLIALLCAAGPAAADGVVVVPGEINGYLYDRASNQSDAGQEISLQVVKTGHFKEYLIESDDGSLRCDETCSETSQRILAGSVALQIIGKKPVSFLNIPLAGKWSEPCSNTQIETDQCVFSLNELNARVSVEVNPDIEPGESFPLPEGGQAMLVTVDTRDGYALVANHENLGPKSIWLEPNENWKSRLNINSASDGRINMEKLLAIRPPSQAALYCRDLGNDWYLPAEKELGLLTVSALEKVSGLDAESYLWSSTEHNLVQSSQKKNRRPYLELQVKVLKNSSATITRSTAYSYDQQEDGSWAHDPPYRKQYQVLCFRRLPF